MKEFYDPIHIRTPQGDYIATETPRGREQIIIRPKLKYLTPHQAEDMTRFKNLIETGNSSERQYRKSRYKLDLKPFITAVRTEAFELYVENTELRPAMDGIIVFARKKEEIVTKKKQGEIAKLQGMYDGTTVANK